MVTDEVKRILSKSLIDSVKYVFVNKTKQINSFNTYEEDGKCFFEIRIPPTVSLVNTITFYGEGGVTLFETYCNISNPNTMLAKIKISAKDG